MTVCTRCKQEKPDSEFSPDPRKRNGLQSVCRECQRRAKSRALEGPQTLYVGMSVTIRDRVRRNYSERTRDAQHGTVYYVHPTRPWVTVEFTAPSGYKYRESYPVDEVEVERVTTVRDGVREWLQQA